MVAGRPNIDYPAADTALSVVVFGDEAALTSRVRKVGENNVHVTAARNEVGEPVRINHGESLDLFWQADDGFRSVEAQMVDVAPDGLVQVRVKGEATRIQRRDAVRAPLGLPVRVVFGQTELSGSTVDLSEVGLRCVFRPHGTWATSSPSRRPGSRSGSSSTSTPASSRPGWSSSAAFRGRTSCTSGR
ncbi:hypothetical protein SAMN05661080_02887 [Modestobacter sp. DSM 44400]|uniref:PilZ domain-containing protein n=1 Tax=Modestobacter sp. DSM 44400 TaxID=1550230 RepID=UPI0008959B01|nr:PilZ domain-containing protein [Modestobacter sp. DSM 44400]SDY26227.1 hypothetical protein SAMN05661080_02887 [Modestobacter sp. DSM 44400]